MGNAQLLPNGNVVVGWGALPYITEFHRDGGVRFDARLPRGAMNYRAFRAPWVGRPRRSPRLVRRAVSGRRRLYASWNGATQVDDWRLETRTGTGGFKPVLTRAKKGFETSLPVPANGDFAVVVALAAGGRILGRSNVVRL
jgi:hypothetical protein